MQDMERTDLKVSASIALLITNTYKKKLCYIVQLESELFSLKTNVWKKKQVQYKLAQ
jgi:hypothetical protein